MIDSPEKRARIRERVQELAGQFLERCVQDLDALREMAARWRSGDTEARGELEHLAHQLCGTAAMLKFDSLSLHASAIERLAEAHTEGTETGMALSVTERLASYLGRLDQELSTLALANK